MKNLWRNFFVRKSPVAQSQMSIEPTFDWSEYDLSTITKIEFEPVDMAVLEAEIDAFSLTFKKNK